MADKSESSSSRKKSNAARGGKKAEKTARDPGPLGTRETRQLSPEELEALRARLQRKFR